MPQEEEGSSCQSREATYQERRRSETGEGLGGEGLESWCEGLGGRGVGRTQGAGEGICSSERVEVCPLWPSLGWLPVEAQAQGCPPRLWKVLAPSIPEVGFSGPGMATLSTDTDSSRDSVCPSVFSAQALPQDSPGTPNFPSGPVGTMGLQKWGKEKETKAVGTVGNPRGAASDVGISRGHG